MSWNETLKNITWIYQAFYRLTMSNQPNENNLFKVGLCLIKFARWASNFLCTFMICLHGCDAMNLYQPSSTITENNEFTVTQYNDGIQIVWYMVNQPAKTQLSRHWTFSLFFKSFRLTRGINTDNETNQNWNKWVNNFPYSYKSSIALSKMHWW